jgi:8-oxo-dGTP diphosphatase
MYTQEPIGVPILVLNQEGKILMAERIKVYGSGLYGMPGGHVELSELAEEAAKRELLEETGLVAEEMEFVGVVRELQKESYNFIHFGFLVKKYHGELKNVEPNKSKDWEWISLDKLPENILPGHKAVLDMFKNQNTPRFRDLV